MVPDAPPCLLLTRPEPQNRLFGLRCRLAEAWTGPILFAPILSIRHLPAPSLVGRIPVFTSQNAVLAVGQGSGPAWAVGAQTAAVARNAGFDCRAAEGDVAALTERLLADAPDRPLVHLRGRHVAGDLAGYLRAAGLTVDEAIVYDQQTAPLTDAAIRRLGQGDPVVAPLFSPRSARIMGAQVPRGAAIRALALSPAVAEAWTAPAEIVASPDAAGMIAAISACRERGLVGSGPGG